MSKKHKNLSSRSAGANLPKPDFSNIAIPAPKTAPKPAHTPASKPSLSDISAQPKPADDPKPKPTLTDIKAVTAEISAATASIEKAQKSIDTFKPKGRPATPAARTAKKQPAKPKKKPRLRADITPPKKHPHPAAKPAPSAKSITITEPKAEPETEPKAEPNTEPAADTAELSQDAKAAKKSAQAKKSSKRHPMPAPLRILLSVLLFAGLSFLFAWFFIWRQNDSNLSSAGAFLSEKPELYAYSALVIFTLMSLLASVTWCPFFTSGLSFALVAILSFVNEQKISLRNAPLLPDELVLAKQAGNLAQFVDTGAVIRLIIGVILVLIASILLEIYAHRVLGREKKGLPFWNRFALIPRITFTAISLAAIVMVSSPIVSHREDVADWLEHYEIFEWDQASLYRHNGFVIGFLYNLGEKRVPFPETYGEASMLAVAEKYRVIKEEDKKNRKPLDEIADNIIIILDETFYDPALLTKYYDHIGGDVTPNLHQIFQKYPSGYMYSPVYGGGTANVEFEVFTGLSNFWTQSTPYNDVIPNNNRSILASPAWARAFGFQTTALHSFYGSHFYQRGTVYPLIGFNKFIDSDGMEHTELEGEHGLYISDRSIYADALDILRSDDDDKKQMIGILTMQNHAPYDAAGYRELNYLIPSGDYSLLENSFQSLHSADRYLGEFLSELDRLDEKTVVLWFGDHVAGLLDNYIKSSDKADRDTAHILPYFIYANFDIESAYDPSDLADTRAELGLDLSLPEYLLETIDLPLTSPNCLLNLLYNTLGAEKPAFLYILDDVCAESPVLTRSYYEADTPEPSDALTDYELFNYDSLAGQKFWDGN